MAVKKESHIDTVLYYRKNYLADRETEETIKKFREMNQNIDVNWDDIKLKLTSA